MCSIGEDDFGDEGGAHTMERDPKPTLLEDEICKKCNENKLTIKVDLKNSMCESCFLHYVRHKFRATLGSTKVVRRNAKVLIVYTGRIENISLIHMVQFGLDQETFKKLCIEPELVFIDESVVNDVEIAERLTIIKKMHEMLSEISKLKCHFVSIAEKSFETLESLKNVSIDSILAKTQEETTFMENFNSLKSMTAKQDFLEVTKNGLLRNLAKKLDIGYVFLSDTSLTLATRLLTNISLGRGSSVAADVGFCDDRGDVKFIRPMKDLNLNEIENYARICNLSYHDSSDYGSDAGKSVSIQNLTSSFIDNLQKNYSATVSTVYRTCSKIAPKSCETKDRCRMCQSTLDFDNSETLYATEFSRMVSEIAADNLTTIDDQRKAEICIQSGKKQSLCHGCRNIFIGMDDNELNEFNF